MIVKTLQALNICWLSTSGKKAKFATYYIDNGYY